MKVYLDVLTSTYFKMSGININKRIRKIRKNRERPKNFVERSRRIGTVPKKDAFDVGKMKLPF